MKPAFILSATIAILASAHAAELPAGVNAEPLAARSPSNGKTLFSQLTPESTGITTMNKMNVDHPMSYLYHSGSSTAISAG